LAFIVTGKVFEKVHVLDLKSNANRSVIRFFGAKTVNSKIRWSNDNKYIAVHKKSDISPNPLYVIDIEKKDIVCKKKRNTAANWFFIKP
jgi:Tol biopolymer transport system component